MIIGTSSHSFALSNFENLEDQLLVCLSYIPYVEENRGVISPKFTPIILEACSLIDSIFKISYVGDKKSNMLTFNDYKIYFEPRLKLHNTISVLLSNELKFFRPFQNWTSHHPQWWSAYNKLKHDRIRNFKLSTFEVAVNSLAALHQVISKDVDFMMALAAAGWLNLDSLRVSENLAAKEYIGVNHFSTMPVESRIFVSPSDENFVQYNEDNNSFYIEPEHEYTARVRNLFSIYACF